MNLIIKKEIYIYINIYKNKPIIITSINTIKILDISIYINVCLYRIYYNIGYIIKKIPDFITLYMLVCFT